MKKVGGHERMSEREAGRFRGRLFGGFNRQDVLAYITSVYEELDYAQTENDMLRQRCEELEALLDQQNTVDTEPVTMPIAPPAAFAPEAEPIWDPVMQTDQVPFELDENTLTTPEDLYKALAPTPEPIPIPIPIPIPVPPVQETAFVKPNLANPYPERSRKVKVRPARES